MSVDSTIDLGSDSICAANIGASIVGLLRKLFRALFNASIPAPWDLWAGIHVISPALVAVVTAMIGLWQDVNLFYLVVGTIIAFAGMSVGLVNFTVWREQRRVDGKIQFLTLLVKKVPDENKFNIGFRIHNKATFPITCSIIEITTRIRNTIPEVTAQVPVMRHVPAGYNMDFYDGIIEYDPPKTGSVGVGASIVAQLRYGRHKRLDCNINIHKELGIGFANGEVQGYSAKDVIEAA